MKFFAILAVIATVVLPVLPASATTPSVSCHGNGDTTNNQSSLSSTSAGSETCTATKVQIIT